MLFHEFANLLSLGNRHVKDILVCGTAPHIPCHSQRCLAYALNFLIQTVNELLCRFRASREKSYPKKSDAFSVYGCLYS